MSRYKKEKNGELSAFRVPSGQQKPVHLIHAGMGVWLQGFKVHILHSHAPRR